jgi:PhnB protein
MQRFSPKEIDGTTGRTLLVVDDPEQLVAQAVAAGATESSPVGDEHGWRLGRIIDPFVTNRKSANLWVSGRRPD